MKNLNESLEKYKYNIINAISDLTNKSSTQIHDIVKKLDADQYINLVAAVDKDNLHAVNRILSTVMKSDDALELEIDQVKKRIDHISRNKDMDWDDKKNQLFGLIKELKSSDWNLIWPDININTLRQLYKFVSKKTVKSVTGEQANEIWTWTKDNIMEQVVYNNQIVEMKITKGPNNTVGILLDNKLIMVPSVDVTPLHEHVMGMMTGMPTLARIKELAGMETKVDETSFPPVLPNIGEIGDQEVQLVGGGGTYTLNALKTKIAREAKELADYVARDAVDFKTAAFYFKKLENSLNTMWTVLDSIENDSLKGN